MHQSQPAVYRFFCVLQRRNRAPDSALRGKIAIRLHTVDEETLEKVTASGDQPSRTVRRRSDLPETPEGIPIVQAEQAFAVEIINHSQEKIFCEAVFLGSDYSIHPLSSLAYEDGYKPFDGQRKRVDPGETQWFGLEASGGVIASYPPDDPLRRNQFVEETEFIKVFASAAEACYDAFTQQGLELPSDETESAFDLVLASETQPASRSVQSHRPKNESDWAAAESR